MQFPGIIKKRKIWLSLLCFGLALGVLLIPYRVGRHEIYPFGVILTMTALELLCGILIVPVSAWNPVLIFVVALLYWLCAPKSQSETA
jgi:hypothetical protein